MSVPLSPVFRPRFSGHLLLAAAFVRTVDAGLVVGIQNPLAALASGGYSAATLGTGASSELAVGEILFDLLQ